MTRREKNAKKKAMGKRDANRAVLLTVMCAWLVGTVAGCGSETRESGGIFSSLQRQESGPYSGATCTISLYNIPGGDEMSLSQAEDILGMIKKETGWANLHIVRTEQVTKVCRGYFESFSSDKAKRTLDAVRSYVDSRGDEPFRQAMFSDLPGVGKQEIVAGPSEWDLRNAPGNSSLCIDVYTDPNKRVNSAIKQVKKLRGKGVEAWYYHGAYRSGVYVGHFNARYEQVTAGRTAGGRAIVRTKFVTRDPEFKKLRRKFPSYRIDGKELSMIVDKSEVRESSRLVPIPRFGEEVIDSQIGL